MLLVEISDLPIASRCSLYLGGKPGCIAGRWALSYWEMNREEHAAKMAVLLQAKAITADDVINWVDSVIVEEARPPAAFIELSTTPKSAVQDIISQLRAIAAPVDDTRAIRLAAADLKSAIERGVLDVQQAAIFTESFLSGTLHRLPNDLMTLYTAHDEFYLAIAEGYGTKEEVAADFLDTLSKVHSALA